MTEVLKKYDDAEVIKTNDKVDPYAVRIDGVIVVKSWSRRLVEAIAQDPGMIEVMIEVIEE